jgi:hypothetical protein
MKSQLFYSGAYETIEGKIKSFLNEQPDFLNASTIGSPRATGDAIQSILESNFENIIGDYCKTYSQGFARRAMADLAFIDQEDLYYVVDVKTHRLETKFNMPNITSVERLARFYEDDKNHFVVLMIAYNIDLGVKIKVEKVCFIPIEFLSWDCLTLGALGWGQIQIANANNIIIEQRCSRKKWMLELCDTLFEFYPREIGKIQHRISYFEKIKKQWEEKNDVWI